MELSPAGQVILTFLSTHEPPQPAEAVIAFGSYHAEVARTAAQLVLDGWAPVLVCTGGNTPLTAHLGTSEAAYFAGIAQEAGLPPSQMLVEPQATNTGENVANSLRLLAEHGITPKTLLVCGIPAHLKRITATFAKQTPQIHIVPILVPFTPADYRTKAGMSMEQRLVAELDRLRNYPAEGFTVPVEIPAEVLEAEAQIRAAH